MWQGLQTITDYKGKHSQELPSDTSLPNELNYFYACFEANNTETCNRAPAVPEDCVITLSTAYVSETFKQVNVHKAAGPDGLPGRVQRACEDQLAIVFTDIFNISLSESVIPTCFQQTTIDPVPKNTKVTCLNDYRPIALTSVAIKCFEMLVMARQNLFPLRRLKRFDMGPQILKRFYSCTIKSMVASLVWKLLGLRPQGTTECSVYGPVHDWSQASCHPGPLH